MIIHYSKQPPYEYNQFGIAMIDGQGVDARMLVLCSEISNVFQPHVVKNNVRDEHVLEFLDSRFQINLITKPFTKDQKYQQISSFEKSIGIQVDNVNSSERLQPKALTFITILFNVILRSSHFPS